MNLTPAEAKVMRAIAAREHKKALAERRAARAAHCAEQAVPSSSTRWDVKPQRSRKAAAAAKALADRAHENRVRWARRHPQLAAAERKLRKARAALLQRWDHKNDGTPETHEQASRRHQGALVQLYKAGGLDAQQLGAAVEIAEAYERIGADVAVRTASLETRVDMTRSGDGSFFEKLSQVRREVAYGRWRAELGGSAAAAIEMIVGDGGPSGPIGFTIVARRYRIHNRKAKALLIAALDLWPRILGAVRKEIDPATLAAAQAGIA